MDFPWAPLPRPIQVAAVGEEQFIPVLEDPEPPITPPAGPFAEGKMFILRSKTQIPEVSRERLSHSLFIRPFIALFPLTQLRYSINIR